MLHSWPYRVVDWKWGYMEDVWQKWAACVERFFEVWDEGKFETGSGVVPEGVDEFADSITPQVAQLLASVRTSGDVPWLSASSEAHAVFSRAVGAAVRWWSGCECHDHIWTSGESIGRQQEQFEEESGGLLFCGRRARRGSELARGKWKDLVQIVRTASSTELQRRLLKLPVALRDAVMGEFEAKILR